MFTNASASTWKYIGPGPNQAVLPFHQKLPDYNVTPLVNLPNIAKELDLGHVLLKDESNRFGLPAFKILGASWAIYKAVASKCSLSLTASLEELGKEARARKLVLVTCTEGNWGRATARMAKYLGVEARVFVPGDMDQATRDKISGEGADVEVVDGSYDDAIQSARREAEKEGCLLVMDVSWEGYEEIPQWVVEGYSTMLLETDHQLQTMTGRPATHAIASVGVGSWAQAVAMHYKSATNPHPATVIAVEPESAACLQTSLRKRNITSIETGHTIMNGMNCGTVSYTAWPILSRGVDASLTVGDKEAHDDVNYLREQGVHVGPCGAATLSMLRKVSREDKARLRLDEHSVVVLFSTEGARDYLEPT